MKKKSNRQSARLKTEKPHKQPSPSSLKAEPPRGTLSERASSADSDSQSAISLRRRRTAYLAASFAVFVFLCYANSLGNGFVFDDHDLVLDNRLIRSIENVPRLLSSSYRPLRDVSYAIDHAVWGMNPVGFHLTNVLLHCITAVLILFLVQRIAGTLAIALSAALIFAVHPIQTDAVSYVSGRRDLLFALFFVLAFFFYIRAKETGSKRSIGLFLFSWVLSLLSKEMAISLPLVVFLWSFCESWTSVGGSWYQRGLTSVKRALRRDLWLYCLLLIAAVAFGLHVLFVQRASIRAGAGGVDYWGGSFLSNFYTSARVQAWYVKQLFLPTPIAQYFGVFDISHSILDWRVLGALALVVSILAGAFILLQKGERIMAFGILAYFAMLLPVSQIIPHHELLADHYLYIPILGFGLVVGVALGKVSKRGELYKKVAYASFALIVLGMAARTVLRNRDWKDDLTVWQANYEAVPGSPRAAFNLAAHNLTRNPKKAEDLFNRALEIDPTYGPTYTNLAQLYLSQNRLRESEEMIEKGLLLSDSQVRAVMTRDSGNFRSQLLTALAVVKAKRGDESKGEELLEEAIRAYPANPDPYSLLASIYHGKDRIKEIEILRRSVAANSAVPETLKRLSLLLIEDRAYDEALLYVNRLLFLIPTDFYANYEAGQIHRHKNDCATARIRFETARSAAANAEERRTVAEAFNRLERQCGSQ